MKSLTTWLSGVLLFATLTACSQDEKAVGWHYQVMGDPMEMMAGSTAKPEVDVSFFENINTMYVFMYLDFTEKKAVRGLSGFFAANGRDLEAENPGGRNVKANIPMQVKRDGERILLSDFTNRFKLTLVFNADLGHYEFLAGNGLTGDKAEVLHFSRSRDGNLASLLLRSTEEGQGHSLGAIYFAREWAAPQLPMSEEQYKYLGGNGVKIGWNTNNIEMNICGATATQYSDTVERAMSKWDRAMPQGVTAKTPVATDYAPFSDLNQSCIYFVDSYFTETSPKVSNFGLTANVIDANKMKIVDADIFIMIKEFEKGGLPFGDSLLSFSLDYTLVHEMGHFLGLDHQFTKGVESVMSYAFKSADLTDYDRRAIHNLYNP